jgi:hypothetical protein
MKVENKWPNEKLPRTDVTRGNILLSRANFELLNLISESSHAYAWLHHPTPLNDHWHDVDLNMIIAASDQITTLVE